MDRQRGGSPVAVVSYSFWKQHYGLDPAVLGKTVQMHQTSFEIIAVAPHLVRGMFYGLSVADPLTLLCTVLLLVVVAVAAGLLPAHRASRVDPIVALRYE